MRAHFATHQADPVAHVVKVVEVLQNTMEHNHVEATEREIQRTILFFESLLIFLVLLPVDDHERHKKHQKQHVQHGERELVLAEV